MNTPSKIKLSDMTEGQRCLVVYDNKGKHTEEAEIMHVATNPNYKAFGLDTPYSVFVRFNDGEEIDCHPSRIKIIK
jgi:hypothetical protein